MYEYYASVSLEGYHCFDVHFKGKSEQLAFDLANDLRLSLKVINNYEVIFIREAKPVRESVKL